MRQAHLHEVPRSTPAPVVIALAPPHDEEAFIVRAIPWLAEQSSPDLIVIRP
jgi:hypothetical protein